VSGTVAAEEAEVDSADIDQQKLAAFVRARMGLIKACYENALKRNPSLKGKISIRFTILETGGIADIQAAVNSLGSPEVASCIINTMRTWRTQFRPSGPVTVEYPFVFAPVN
jgi:TonB family protein